MTYINSQTNENNVARKNNKDPNKSICMHAVEHYRPENEEE